MPKKLRDTPPLRYESNGHTLLCYIRGYNVREIICDTWPDLAGRYKNVSDAIAKIDEFEWRASGGAAKADDTSKGAA